MCACESILSRQQINSKSILSDERSNSAGQDILIGDSCARACTICNMQLKYNLV